MHCAHASMSSPVEGVVLRFLPGEDVTASHVQVDVVQWGVHPHSLSSLPHRRSLQREQRGSVHM